MHDSFTQHTFIGDDVEIYPMKIKDKDIVSRHFSRLYGDEAPWFMNILDDTTYKDLLKLLRIALDRDDVEDLMDVQLAQEAVKVFKEISQLSTSKETQEAPKWNQLYASLTQNTSMKVSDIMELTVAQLEDLLDGLAVNNGVSESRSSGGSPERLEDEDALRYILNNGGKL